MASYADNAGLQSKPSVADQTRDLIDDVAGEMKHEANQIKTRKEPVDPSQSDDVVRRHAAGLSIWFFLAIGLFLVIVMAGIMIYTSSHH